LYSGDSNIGVPDRWHKHVVECCSLFDLAWQETKHTFATKCYSVILMVLIGAHDTPRSRSMTGCKACPQSESPSRMRKSRLVRLLIPGSRTSAQARSFLAARTTPESDDQRNRRLIRGRVGFRRADSESAAASHRRAEWHRAGCRRSSRHGQFRKVGVHRAGVPVIVTATGQAGPTRSSLRLRHWGH
jgi:hypothetical protein